MNATPKLPCADVIRLAPPSDGDVLLAAIYSPVLKLRHTRVCCRNGGYHGKQVSQLFEFSHQDALGSGVLHPVLLPPEGKTLTQVF